MKYISACFVIDLRDNLFTKVTQLSFGVILVLLLTTPGGGGQKKIYLASSQTTPVTQTARSRRSYGKIGDCEQSKRLLLTQGY